MNPLETDIPLLAERIESARQVDWNAALQTLGLRAAGALLIALIGVWLVRSLVKGLDRVLTRANVEPISRIFLRNLAYAVMLVFVGIAVLQQLGVPPASLFAMLGAAGLAIGLALKDSLANIASGVLLIVQKPFHVGDVVQIGGHEGRVNQVRIFTTGLRTLDNRDIIIPNSVVTSEAIINLSRQPTRRIDIAVGVGYDDDLSLARSTLMNIATSDSRVLRDPEPLVLVNNLSESSVDLELRFWVDADDIAEAKSDINQQVRDQLMAKGLNIPYPTRDLHVYHHDADGRDLMQVIKSVAHDGDGDYPDPQKKA